MDNRPVLFIDSGIGGVPYAQFFRARNRREEVVYAADREHFPYGPRTRENVIELALSFVDELVNTYDPKILAVACNTISVSALSALRERFSGLFVVGTVPAVKPAVIASRKRRVTVLGTQRAVEDPYMRELAAKYGPDCTVLGEPAPELVNFVEQRWLAADDAEKIAAVTPWTEKALAKGADALVLACTHFLLLRDEFLRAGGSELMIFDSVEGVSRRIESTLDEDRGKLRSDRQGDADAPVFAVTGKRPLEPQWKTLCARFGFTLENGQ